jgi:hypothetical protein
MLHGEVTMFAFCSNRRLQPEALSAYIVLLIGGIPAARHWSFVHEWLSHRVGSIEADSQVRDLV